MKNTVLESLVIVFKSYFLRIKNEYLAEFLFTSLFLLPILLFLFTVLIIENTNILVDLISVLLIFLWLPSWFVVAIRNTNLTVKIAVWILVNLIYYLMCFLFPLLGIDSDVLLGTTICLIIWVVVGLLTLPFFHFLRIYRQHRKLDTKSTSNKSSLGEEKAEEELTKKNKKRGLVRVLGVIGMTVTVIITIVVVGYLPFAIRLERWQNN